MTIAFDANIWVSFTIGKRLAVLKDILLHPVWRDPALQTQVLVVSCAEISREYQTVVRRPKLRKYITPERVSETLDLMARVTDEVVLTRTVTPATGSRDPNDNYLLALAEQVPLDYLITGDRDLLVLQRWHQTELIAFPQFEAMITALLDR